MGKTATKSKRAARRREPGDLFEPEQVYSTAEVAEALSTSVHAVRAWVRDGRLDRSGVIELPRGRRMYGWALNTFVRNSLMG